MADRAAAPRRSPLSIRARIVIVAILVVGAALALGAVGIVRVLDTALVAQATQSLEAELETIADGLESGSIDAASLEERDDDILIAWHTASGTAVNDDDAGELPVPRNEGEAEQITVDDERYLVMAEDVDGGMLVVGRSIDELGVATSTTAVILAIAVPVALLLIGTIMWVVVTRALSPVTRIRTQVDAIDATALDRRVPTTGSGDEIDRLAGTMNRMLDRVEDGYRARQRFVGDASHELRSPLATMRQFAELARTHPDITQPAELIDVVIEEGGRMQGIVEGLLLLARLDEHAGVGFDPVDLDDLALTEAQRVRGLATCDVDAREVRPVQVTGNQRLLGQALRNVVDNAVRHARGAISLSTSTTPAGTAVIRVDDDGIGIPASERERVFERFVRLDEARSRDAGGTGLGLAIVREIARAHGGTVRVEASPLGGAAFILELPARFDAES